MTAQIGEKLRYEGQQVWMCTEPLSDYFALAGLKPRFVPTSTANRRGYVGTWEIVDGRLYLTHLAGALWDVQELTLETFFPGCPDRVFAHWFTGSIRIPQGKLIEYVHMEYASTFERDVCLDIEKGVVKKTRVHENTPAAFDDASEISRAARRR